MKHRLNQSKPLIYSTILGSALLVSACNSAFLNKRPINESKIHSRSLVKTNIDLVLDLSEHTEAVRISSNLWVRIADMFLTPDKRLTRLSLEAKWVEGRKKNGKFRWKRKHMFFRFPILGQKESIPGFEVIALAVSKTGKGMRTRDCIKLGFTKTPEQFK